MKKIPNVFEYGPDFKVVDQVRPESAWVLAGEGEATEKLDGTNVRLTVRAGALVRIEKRRNPTKDEKKRGIIDPWYVDADPSFGGDKWIIAAAEGTDVSDWPDGEHSCEALGPKIQGNPLGLDQHLCVPFYLSAPRYNGVHRSFEGLKQFLAEADSKYSPGHKPEGIVFHHPDGRRAKIRCKDFVY